MASLFLTPGMFSLEAKTKTKGASVTLAKNVYTLEPGQNIVLTGKISTLEKVKPQVWSVYAYFPSTPEQFRHKCKLQVVNPRSAWGLVRIIKHTPISHILRKDGSFQIVISTKNWVEGSYALTASFAFFNPEAKGKSQHFSIPLTVYAVLEK